MIPIKIPSGPGAFQLEKFFNNLSTIYSVILLSFELFIFEVSMLYPPEKRLN